MERIETDTEQGCHALGLPGDLRCRYKHDILVEQEKKEKKKPGSDPEKVRSGAGHNGDPEIKMSQVQVTMRQILMGRKRSMGRQ